MAFDFLSFACPPLPRDTLESIASRFRLAERAGEPYVDAYMYEQPSAGLINFIADLIGAPESEWRCTIRPARVGVWVYIYRVYSPMMQAIHERRRVRLGY